MPTGIEWTDETWNPVTGCTKVSAVCKNCYAERSRSARATLGIRAVDMSRLVAEVEPPGVYGDIQVIFLFRDHGGGNMEPACWPDDWPLDITLDQMRARGVRVVGHDPWYD